MKFSQAVSAFWSNYGNFRSRSRRSAFWFASLFLFLGNIGAAVLDGLLGLTLDPETGLGAVQIIWTLVIIVPSMSVLVRRLHDTGRSGWWILIILIPVVGAITLLVFSFQDSAPGDNRWGPSPK